MSAKLLVTLFEARPEVGGVPLHPLSAGRIAMLEERGNPLVAGLREGETVSSWSVFEVLMVASLEDEELVEVSMEDDHGWRAAVKRFSLPVEDETLAEFWTILEAELEAIREAQVTTKKKTAGARRRKPARARTGG